MNLIPATGVNYMFLDLNSFFASCEQEDFPDLRGEPIIVVPCDSDYTCAIAASYEAKAYGVKTGTKVHEAKRLIGKKLRVVPARHKAYRQYHDKVIEEVVKYTPIRRIWSIDEFDSRLMERHRTREGAHALGMQIKKGLRENIGPCIKASIGFAPNSYLGKMATDMKKPDGLVILEGKDLPHALDGLSLRDLCGIGESMEKRLIRAGVRSVRDLWNCSPKQARAIWHSVGGERFWYNLHGVVIPETETERNCIGHSRVLDTHLRDPDAAFQVMRRLISKAVQRMRREGFMTCHLTLSVRTVRDERWGIDLKIPQTDDVRDIIHFFEELWRSGIMPRLRDRVKHVSVLLSGLVETAHATDDMFLRLERQQRKQELAVRRTMPTPLETIMEKINGKFGPQTINLGMIPDLNGAPIGTKIAFSRVPDMAEFGE